MENVIFHQPIRIFIFSRLDRRFPKRMEHGLSLFKVPEFYLKQNSSCFFLNPFFLSVYRNIRQKNNQKLVDVPSSSWFLKHNYILLMRVILAGDIFQVLFYSVFSIISNYLPCLTASLCSSTSHYDTLTLPTNCITRIPALSDKLHIPNICIIWLIAHSKNLGKITSYPRTPALSEYAYKRDRSYSNFMNRKLSLSCNLHIQTPFVSRKLLLPS